MVGFFNLEQKFFDSLSWCPSLGADKGSLDAAGRCATPNTFALSWLEQGTCMLWQLPKLVVTFQSFMCFTQVKMTWWTSGFVDKGVVLVPNVPEVVYPLCGYEQ